MAFSLNCNSLDLKWKRRIDRGSEEISELGGVTDIDQSYWWRIVSCSTGPGAVSACILKRTNVSFRWRGGDVVRVF